MAIATAFLKNYRQSPRKVRLVAMYVKGKPVMRALAELDLLPKRASSPLKKLIQSAVSNAKNLDMEADSLIIKEMTVDQGVTLKRRMPRARGSAFPINKRTSHVRVTLEGQGKVVVTSKAEKVTKKTVKVNKKDKTKADEPKAKTAKKPTAKKVVKKEVK